MAEAEAKFRVERLFSTPLLVAELQNAPTLNAELEAAILKRRDEHPGVRRSNIGGWHSAQDMLAWGGDPMRAVARSAAELATANTADARAEAGAGPKWQIEAWANVNEAGAFNSAHYHGGCYWSAVYYVRVDPGEGGGLVLQDPRLPGLVMYSPRLSFRNAGPQHTITIAPRPGLLLLFPAWLSHSVAPWQGEGLRISIAMNLMLRAN